MIKDKNYWESKHPTTEQVYKGRPIPGTKINVDFDVRHFIWNDDVLLKHTIQAAIIKDGSLDDIALNCQRYVVKLLKYVTDDDLGASEFWLFPSETLLRGKGDCFAEYEYLYSMHGLIQVKDIKIGTKLLSYDFNNKKYVYKPVIKLWNKGILPLARVHFRNGQHIDVTTDHPMLVRQQSLVSNYFKVPLKQIDLNSWYKRKVPMAKKIPYIVKDISWLNLDLCFVLGHFLAEGWIDKSQVCTSGYDIYSQVIPLLEKNEIPFTESKNNSGVPVVRFLDSMFKDFLKTLKTNSFDIHLPEYIFNLPPEKLERILAGEFIGDGHFSDYPDQRGYTNNKEYVISTSCEKFAEDIQRLGLQLGKSFHIWKQEHHGGSGKYPIWRITYNPQSHFLKDFGFCGLSEVSISYIEPLLSVQAYDFEVQDTHNVVFKNGILTHQCEDGANLIASLILNCFPIEESWRIRVAAGYVQASPTAEFGGHGYCTYCRTTDNEWVVLDWCYLEDSAVKIADKILHKDNKPYKDIWFSFNNQYAWAHDKFDLRGRSRNYDT